MRRHEAASHLSRLSIGSCSFACESEGSTRHLAPHACSRQLLPAFPPTSLQSGYQWLLARTSGLQDVNQDGEDDDRLLVWLPGYRKLSLGSLLRRTRTRAKVRTLDGRVHTRSPTVHVYVSGFRLIGIMMMASSAVTMPPLPPTWRPRVPGPSSVFDSSLASFTSGPKRSVIVTSLTQSW